MITHVPCHTVVISVMWGEMTRVKTTYLLEKRPPSDASTQLFGVQHMELARRQERKDVQEAVHSLEVCGQRDARVELFLRGHRVG